MKPNAIRRLLHGTRKREMAERKQISARYRAERKAIYATCDHEYGKWFIRHGTAIPDTNLFGEPFEHKKCKYCGHDVSRLKQQEK